MRTFPPTLGLDAEVSLYRKCCVSKTLGNKRFIDNTCQNRKVHTYVADT